jgi:hypothetical protein
MLQKLSPRNNQLAAASFEIARPFTFPYQSLPWSTKRLEHPEPLHIRKAAVLALQTSWTLARDHADFPNNVLMPYPALTKNNVVIVYEHELQQAMVDQSPKTVRRLGRELLGLAQASDKRGRESTGNKGHVSVGKMAFSRVATHKTKAGWLLTLEPGLPLESRRKTDSLRQLQLQRRDSLQAISDMTGWEPGLSAKRDIGIPFARLADEVPQQLREGIAGSVQTALLKMALDEKGPQLAGFDVGRHG